MPAKYVLAHKDTGYHWNLLSSWAWAGASSARTSSGRRGSSSPSQISASLV